jgi:hypothetical protein
MQTTTRTIYSSYLQTVLLRGKAFQMAANSTLNELLQVQSGVAPTVTPTLKYYAIGNGGHAMVTGANGIPLINPVQHNSTDAGLFHQLPFVLRELGNDIDAITQADYALRRIETHNGLQYIAYYLKRLPETDVPDMEYLTVANGVTTTTAFTPNTSNLNPTPPALNNGGVNTVSGDYVASSSKVAINLTPTEITELLNMANIIYGDPAYAIISEIALCSGVDKTVQSPNGTGNNASMINFNEAIAVQCLSFLNTFFSMPMNTSGAEILLDVGTSEPCFVLV